jgi:hypothetical protein
MCKHVLDLLISKAFILTLFFQRYFSFIRFNLNVHLIRFARLHKSAFATELGGSGLGGSGVGSGVGSGENAPYQKNIAVYLSLPSPILRAFDAFYW